MEKVSNVKDKRVEMEDWSESSGSCGIASAREAKHLASGVYVSEAML